MLYIVFAPAYLSARLARLLEKYNLPFIHISSLHQLEWPPFVLASFSGICVAVLLHLYAVHRCISMIRVTSLT